MKSLKKFKRLIVEGKESPLQDENSLPADLKIPEIRESAYKIILKHQNQDSKIKQSKEHTIVKRQQIKISDKVASPTKIQNTKESLDLYQDLNTRSEPSNIIFKKSKQCKSEIKDSKLSVLELTQNQLEYLEKVISHEKQLHQNRIKQGQSISKLQQKVAGLRKKYASIQQTKKTQSSPSHTHHPSDYQTQILSVPSSFDDFPKTQSNSSHSTQQKQIHETICTQTNYSDENTLEFKKIMYILESKNKVVDVRSQNQIYKFRQPITNNYRLMSEINIPSLSFQAQSKKPQKKAELIQIVTMLNTKYNKNIQFD